MTIRLSGLKGGVVIAAFAQGVADKHHLGDLNAQDFVELADAVSLIDAGVRGQDH